MGMMGAIGKRVVLGLRGFDCTVLAHDPVPGVEFAREHGVELLLDEVVGQADFLSLHVPLLPETQEMINSSFLSKMKRGAFLINTLWGEAVDEQALLEALQSGHLGGAALDTLVKEPPGAETHCLLYSKSLSFRTWAPTQIVHNQCDGMDGS
jgi:phosphoglycerate dehydrogenase-like enzyme